MYVNIKQLHFKYSNTKQETITDFNLTVNKGEIISILGRSGSGKSTILRLLTGLESPSKGQIYINGQIMVNDQIFIKPEDRGIGMVFQDYALFPHMTVEKNIMFGLNKGNRKSKKDRVNDLLELINLVGYEKRYPHELSGGQQQRVALARALAPLPSLILLDEPFSNLDAELQESIRTELKDILKKASTTTLLVTHDVAVAKALSDRIVTLDKGNIMNVYDV
ncbi:ABC transporter ATP-binding protein [Haloplasma contractile]|uniref:ABC-type quaternary amine transporter n=1 Tax=Haloplasma contractile SSD-17B TaxID=1033810 RepID=U2E8A5_9MOLU|nr:ABC transporter ATP-binding protein [Haloplasma contractile]ERJ11418.1 ABC transporter ATP-binding protein [Haloplasma contractile SSD-17B]